MRDRIVRFATTHPKKVFLTVVILVAALGSQMVRVVVDTDPQNMLPADQAERLFHNRSKETFALHDMLVVGVVNDEDEDGVFNPQSLARIHALSRAIAKIDGVIKRDLLSPSTVDKVTPEGMGTVRFAWLLDKIPVTRAEARRVRDDAMRLSMLKGTLVSDSGKAVAMYVPLADKSQSHRISQEIKQVVAGYSGAERYFVTGLPVAEDTFGVEMFVQMAISAPMAALVIFIILWWFFRSIPLITAPMLLAMSTVVVTMGALIGLGFTVHIMSSMIPIFLMPIAVVNSVHILSEFSDSYRAGADKRQVMHGVMKKLFTPMLYTSLTTIAGFGSLALAPIPPVRVFGAFVAIGVAVSFLLSVIFIPAYVASLSDKTLARLPGSDDKDPVDGEAPEAPRGLLARLLPRVGRWSVSHSHAVIVGMVALSAISAYGISQININDNPVLWFKPTHELRVADRVLNKHFAGTYPAYLVVSKQGAEPELKLERAVAAALAKAEDQAAAKRVAARYQAIAAAVKDDRFDQRVTQLIEKVDGELERAAEGQDAAWEAVMGALEQSQADHKYFQSPAALAFLAGLQAELGRSAVVGKTTSLADVVKTLYRDLHDGSAKYYKVPATDRAVAQSLLTYQSSHRPQDLWHFVTPDMRQASVWVQLKSGDNQSMMGVVDRMKTYLDQHPAPAGVQVRWAGMTYLNVVWQQAMVSGMLKSLLGSFVIVLVMMIFLFRSVLFGLLSMIPLSVTITMIYGLIGLLGKDYDMPVAVLSAMTLGLSVDFAIHFLQRARRIQQRLGDWRATLEAMYHGPGRAIARNAIVIAFGFLPLLAAPLVPYNTVGFFMAAIMAVSSAVTLVLLPSAMNLLSRWLKPLPQADHPVSQTNNESNNELALERN